MDWNLEGVTALTAVAPSILIPGRPHASDGIRAMEHPADDGSEDGVPDPVSDPKPCDHDAIHEVSSLRFEAKKENEIKGIQN